MLRRVLLFGALAVAVTACGDEGDDAGTAAALGSPAWEQVRPGGDCQCSDGSEFSFWVRDASPEKVVLYLQDGGACFSAATCAPERDLYNVTVNQGPIGEGGVFDFAHARNPFADHSVVYVPYCTGDVHLGNATTEYAPGLTVRHNGFVNGTAALDHLVATFPDATDVVVIGESAGSVASPLYAGLLSDRLPEAKITVLAHGSGSYPEASAFDRLLADVWQFDTVVPAWPENAGLTPEQWSFPRLFVQSGRRDREIVFARYDHAYDETQESWYTILGVPARDLLSRIDANERQIEEAGVNVSSYVAPGAEHVVLADGLFYTEDVSGWPLVDWVASLVEGEPVDDVRCTKCDTLTKERPHGANRRGR